MQNCSLKSKIDGLPRLPGVYYLLNTDNEIIYIGKATNLKMRVATYWQKPGNRLIERMISEVASIRTQPTASALEAYFLESQEINHLQPRYNVLQKDDKSKFVLIITNEKIPQIFLTRENNQINSKSEIRNSKKFKIKNKIIKGDYYGPFANSEELKTALKLMRRIFSYCEKPHENKPCFYYHINLCPGICAGKISLAEYKKQFRHIKLFLSGKVGELKKVLAREMRFFAKEQKFEQAEIIKKQFFALEHIQDIALTFSNDRVRISKDYIVEAFDISNLGGSFAVGARIVFVNGVRAKEHYRKFKVKSEIPTLPASRQNSKFEKFQNNEYNHNSQISDLTMMGEILERRKKHPDWIRPNLIVIDGGRIHLNLAKKILGIKIPIVAIAKGQKRKKDEFFGYKIPKEIQAIAIKSRDEAHRFAIKYHRLLRRKNYTKNEK